MAVNWQPVDLPTGGGIDTKTDEKRVQAPNVVDLQNIVFTDAPGWRKRNGYTALNTGILGSTSELTSGARLAVRSNELIQFDDQYLNTYSTNAGLWKQVSRVFGTDVTTLSLTETRDNQTSVCSAVLNGIRLTAWVSDTDDLVHYEVSDDTTGSVLVANTAISNSDKPRIIANSSTIQLVYHDSAATALKRITILPSDPTNVQTGSLVTDVHGDGVFDVCNDPDIASNSWVVYKTTTPTVVGFRLDADGGIALTTTLSIGATAVEYLAINSSANTSDGTCVLSVSGIASSVGYNRAYTDGFSTAIYSSQNTGSVSNIANLQVITTYTGSSATVDYFFEVTDSSNPHNSQVRYDSEGVSGFTLKTPVTYRHSGISSKIFKHNGTAYIVINYDSVLQRKYFLLDIHGNIHSRILDGIGYGRVSGNLPTVQQVSGKYEVALGFRKRLSIDELLGTAATANIFSESGAVLARFDYSATGRYRSVQSGNTLYTQAGMLLQYDGRTVRESGFHLFPEKISVGYDTGSGLDATSTYNYRVYYEYTNAFGERQRSTALITTADTTSGREVTLTIPTLQHASDASNISIVVYRTEGNASVTAGAPFYRVSDPNPANNTGDNRYVNNTTASDTVAFVDNLADSSLLSRELDYQNTGELDNTAPPSGNVMAYAKSRIWVAGTTDDTAVYFSKLQNQGDLIEFHDGNVITIPAEGGPVTAIAELAYHVIFFKRDAIYAVSGDGPDNLGQGFFNVPVLATADVGCNNQASVVRTNEGVIFQSDKGIYRIGNSFELSYIGAAVEAYNDVTITGATVVNDTNQIRFLTSGDRCLVYDYLFNQWTTFTNHRGYSSVLWRQTYTYLRTDGDVFTESATEFTDNGAAYSWLVRYAPVAITGSSGYQRVKRIHMLGSYYSPHTLRMRLNYDNGGFVDSGTWDPSGVVNTSTYGSGAYGSGAYGGTGSPAYNVRFNLPRQKCSMLAFELSDLPSSNGRAAEIDAIQLYVAAKPGNNKLSSGRTFSATGGSTT